MSDLANTSEVVRGGTRELSEKVGLVIRAREQIASLWDEYLQSEPKALGTIDTSSSDNKRILNEVVSVLTETLDTDDIDEELAEIIIDFAEFKIDEALESVGLFTKYSDLLLDIRNAFVPPVHEIPKDQWGVVTKVKVEKAKKA